MSRLSTASISSSVPNPNTFGLPSEDAYDPAPLIARERALLVVGGDDVLAQLGAERLERVAKVPDDREVAQDRAPALEQVVAHDARERGGGGARARSCRAWPRPLFSLPASTDGLSMATAPRQAGQQAPPRFAPAHLERLDDAEQSRCRPSPTAGEQAGPDAQPRERGENETRSGELAAVLLLHRRPQLAVDELRHGVRALGEPSRVERLQERQLDPARAWGSARATGDRCR